MTKKKTGKSVKTAKLPKWAFWGLWFVGILGSLALILIVLFQIWVSTWKTYKINGVIVRVPYSWDVRDTSKDSEKVGPLLVVGYQSIVKVGDKSTDVIKGPDDLQNYQGNVVIYVVKNISSGEYIKEVQTEGSSSIKNTFYMWLGNLVSSHITTPSK